jgi:hypothetical protein
VQSAPTQTNPADAKGAAQVTPAPEVKADAKSDAKAASALEAKTEVNPNAKPAPARQDVLAVQEFDHAQENSNEKAVQ